MDNEDVTTFDHLDLQVLNSKLVKFKKEQLTDVKIIESCWQSFIENDAKILAPLNMSDFPFVCIKYTSSLRSADVSEKEFVSFLKF